MKAHNYCMLLIAFLAILSCSRDKNPVEPEENNYFYPVKIGNRWEYSRTFTTTDSLLKPSNVYKNLDTTVTFVSRIKVQKKAIVRDSINTYVFHETRTENQQTFTNDAYYTNCDSGLYLYAYNGGGYVMPKSSHGKRILFNEKYFNSIKEMSSYVVQAAPDRYMMDSLIYEIPPLQILKYPVETGSQWIYRTPHNPWHIDKKILGREMVEVPAGPYDCYKIQWLYDMDDDGVWDEDIIFYDYVCEKGLIKRTVLFKNIGIVDMYESDEPIGFWYSTDESVLTKVVLK